MQILQSENLNHVSSDRTLHIVYLLPNVDKFFGVNPLYGFLTYLSVSDDCSFNY